MNINKCRSKRKAARTLSREEVAVSPVFKIMFENRNKHGVKRNLYGQYKKFCTNKIFKLRLKNKEGKAGGKKSKYVFNKANFISRQQKLFQKQPLLLALKVQRYWAEAMDFKEKGEQNRQQGLSRPRTDFKIKYKLAIAAKLAFKLLELVRGEENERISIQTQAYANMIKGLYLLQIQEWKQSKESLMISKQIVQQVCKCVDSLDRNIYQAALEKIQNSLKVCHFRESADLKDAQTQETVHRSKGILTNLQSGKTQVGQSELCVFGQPVTIKDAKLKQKLQAIQLKKLEVEKVQQQQQKLTIFLLIFQLYDQILTHLAKLKADPKLSQAQNTFYQRLIGFYKQARLRTQLQRQQEQWKQLLRKFDQQQPIKLQAELISKKSKIKMIKPHSLIKASQNIIYLSDCISQLEKRFSRKPSLEFDRIGNIFRQYKTVYIALILLAKKRWTDSLQCLSEAERESKQLENSHLIDTIQLYKLKGLIQHNLSNLTEEHQNISKIHNLQINQKEKFDSVYSKLKRGYSLEQGDQKLPILKIPGSLELLPPRPVFLDVCGLMVEYPNIQSRTQQKVSFWDRINIFKR